MTHEYPFDKYVTKKFMLTHLKIRAKSYSIYSYKQLDKRKGTTFCTYSNLHSSIEMVHLMVIKTNILAPNNKRVKKNLKLKTMGGNHQNFYANPLPL